MTAFTYTAKRSITAGHVLDTAYAIDLRCTVRDPVKDVGKSESRSMSGAVETVMWRNMTSRQITTGTVGGADVDLVREFLESVIAGETFQFDEFGSADSPDVQVSVVLDGVYREERAVRRGDGGRNDLFRFTFSIRQVP